MKNKLLFTFALVLSHVSLLIASWAQEDFLIGIYSPPIVTPNIICVPCDYNGDGKADLSIKINSGSCAGEWKIDYYSPIDTFDTYSWDLTYPGYGGSDAVPVPADYDGDGIADLSVKTSTGSWLIDYACNNFGSWDLSLPGYGGSDVVPVPADYDGDGIADLSVKTSSGLWNIDYADNGFGSWDETRYGCGGSGDIPAPADYDGDGKTDISIKFASGAWVIDKSSDGFGSWSHIRYGCGGSEAIPVPADYNGGGKDDISVKTSDGYWKIDYAENGFGSWDLIIPGYGLSDVIPVPADYDGDGKADISIKTASGAWLIDYACNGFGSWDWCSEKEKNDGDYDVNILYEPDVENLNLVKSCFVNLLIDPNVMVENTTYRTKDYYLSLANNADLKVSLMGFYSDSIFSDTIITPDNKYDFVNHFKNELSNNLQETIFGVYLGDEPSPRHYENICQWTNFFKREYEEKPVFYNLLPRYAFSDSVKYENYLDSFITNNQADIFSFDHYPFRSTGFVKSYFYNLHLIDKKANDKPFWSTVAAQTWDGTGIIDPTEQQLHFMAFCPIAYGAKGITYCGYNEGFKNNSLKYSWIKNINHYIKNIIGPVIMTSQNTATLHNGNTSLNSGYSFNSDELISNHVGMINSVNKADILLGLFDRSYFVYSNAINIGSSYIWVVNKNIDNSLNNVVIKFNGNYYNKIFVAPRVINYSNNPVLNYSSVPTTYNNITNTTEINISQLNIGEGMMIKVITNNVPVPADFDGDGKTDLSIKTSLGNWIIDYSSNGFGSCDLSLPGYGGSDAVPIPADYDGDGMADLCVKTTNGSWLIDYANNGFGSWDYTRYGCGGSDAIPVPADYNGGGKDDISVKTSDGYWKIDYAENGFGSWDLILPGYGLSDVIPVPADYDGDGKADISIKTASGAWLIDYACNGFGSWDDIEPGLNLTRGYFKDEINSGVDDYLYKKPDNQHIQDDIDFIVYDINGRLVLNTNEMEEVETLSNGFYVIVIKENGSITTKKIIINNK